MLSASRLYNNLKNNINPTLIQALTLAHQQGKLTNSDKIYYESLITQFVQLANLPQTADLLMHLLPEYKITVPALLDAMAFRALKDKNAKACVFACFMLDQSLLERNLSPLYKVILDYGTPELWVQLIQNVNHVPVEDFIKKVYQSDKNVQEYWEKHILHE